MNLEEMIFGGNVRPGGDSGAYRDSIQAWIPIKNIMGGVVITKDNRFVKILELLPVNVYLKSANDRQNIVSSFAAYLKIAPNDLQMVARTLPADTQAYVEQMRRFAEQEENEDCREMIEDNIQEIGYGIASDAMRHRFFLVFQYEANMRAKHNTAKAILQRLNEEADTARRYLDACELEVLEPRYSDNFVLKLLYEILNKQTGQRVRLPDGVFDMTTAVHGIYEDECAPFSSSLIFSIFKGQLIVTKSLEDGNILCCYVPYPVKLDLAVVMDNDIPNAFDMRPLDLFFCRASVLLG